MLRRAPRSKRGVSPVAPCGREKSVVRSLGVAPSRTGLWDRRRHSLARRGKEAGGGVAPPCEHNGSRVMSPVGPSGLFPLKRQLMLPEGLEPPASSLGPRRSSF